MGTTNIEKLLNKEIILKFILIRDEDDSIIFQILEQNEKYIIRGEFELLTENNDISSVSTPDIDFSWHHIYLRGTEAYSDSIFVRKYPLYCDQCFNELLDDFKYLAIHFGAELDNSFSNSPDTYVIWR